MGYTNLFLAVLLLNGFAYLTIVLRPKIYGVQLFRPMVWNFKLSLLPLLVLIINPIIFIVFRYISTITEIKGFDYIGILLFIVGSIIWVLLLPNAGYLITELNLTHRNMDEKEVPIWYDIVSILSFSLSGVLNTLCNIVIIQYIYLLYYDPISISRHDTYFFMMNALIINLLVSVGVYLGRSIRFNSWDIIHITSFFKKLWNHFKQKGIVKDFILFVMFHTTFFMIMYLSFGLYKFI